MIYIIHKHLVAVRDKLFSLSFGIDVSSQSDKKQGMCAPEISSEFKWIFYPPCLYEKYNVPYQPKTFLLQSQERGPLCLN